MREMPAREKWSQKGKRENLDPQDIPGADGVYSAQSQTDSLDF